MGWWEQNSSSWKVCIVAQVGGAGGLGGGIFLFQFKSPDLPIKPVYLAIAGGFGIGGSIGSAATIPWSAIIKQFLDPQSHPDTDSAIYSDLDLTDPSGGISCQDINHSRLLIGQATGSVVLVGAQKVIMSCSISHLIIGSDRPLFTCGLQIPTSLPKIAAALEDTPQIQGGLGAGIFGFAGFFQYIGTS